MCRLRELVTLRSSSSQRWTANRRFPRGLAAVSSCCEKKRQETVGNMRGRMKFCGYSVVDVYILHGMSS